MIFNGFLLELIWRVDHLVDQNCPYIYTKRRVYYFSRRVPEDLKGHYKRDRIVLSLRTKSLKAAQVRTVSLVAKLNEDWLTLRWRSEMFFQSADRCVGYMVKLLGDRPIDTYTRVETNQLRDAFSERGLRKVSIRRNFSIIRVFRVNNALNKETLSTVKNSLEADVLASV